MSKQPILLFPNAKINIGLNITGKRLDGYHNIESLFYPVSIHDSLEISPSDKFELILYNSHPIEEKDNLCFKAWKLLNQKYQIGPVKINLVKGIPSGAGLGGGSSDAANTLKALNNFFALNLTNDQLILCAMELGSDCGFFINNISSLIQGRGEVINPFQLELKGYHITIIHSGIHISTAEAYAGVTPKKQDIQLSELLKQPISEWKETIFNDFEFSIFPKYPLIKNIKEKLYDIGAVYASMTGSGSALYAISKSELVIPTEFEDYFTWKGLF